MTALEQCVRNTQAENQSDTYPPFFPLKKYVATNVLQLGFSTHIVQKLGRDFVRDFVLKHKWDNLSQLQKG